MTSQSLGCSGRARVNTELWEFNPFVTPDGGTLIYTGLNYPEGFGFGDLYVSFQVQHHAEWTRGTNIGPTVNTELDEYHPSLSPDGNVLFFVRHSYDPWIPGDIYAIKVSKLGNRLHPRGTQSSGD